MSHNIVTKIQALEYIEEMKKKHQTPITYVEKKAKQMRGKWVMSNLIYEILEKWKRGKVSWSEY